MLNPDQKSTFNFLFCLVVLTFFLLCLGVICCLCKCQLVDQSISLLLIFLSFTILLSVLFSIYLSFFKVYLFVLSSLDSSLGSTSAWKVGGLLCILTSELVLRMPFAGQNHFFGVKNRIKITGEHNLSQFHWDKCYKANLSF